MKKAPENPNFTDPQTQLCFSFLRKVTGFQDLITEMWQRAHLRCSGHDGSSWQ